MTRDCVLCLAVLLLSLGTVSEGSAQTRLAGVLTFESVETGAAVIEHDPDVSSVDSSVARSGRHSIRIRHDDENDSDLTFAYPESLTGSVLEVRAWIRTEGLDGHARLVMGASGIEYETPRADSASGSSEWAEYRIEVPLSAPTAFVHFGLEVAGVGTAWIDDLALLLDGVPVTGSVAGTLSNRGCTFAGLKYDDWSGNGAFEFEFQAGRGLQSDGRGPYRGGVDQVETYIWNSGIRLYPYGRGGDPNGSRSVTVSLDRPLAGVPDLGTREITVLIVHWKQDHEERLISGPLDMPIGAVEPSQRLEMLVPLNGRLHILRFGELDVRRCWASPFLDGSGTTEPMIHRVSETEWTVDLPPGSVGRLSEGVGQLSDAATGHFEDRGFYEISGRFTIRRLKTAPRIPGARSP